MNNTFMNDTVENTPYSSARTAAQADEEFVSIADTAKVGPP